MRCELDPEFYILRYEGTYNTRKQMCKHYISLEIEADGADI